MGTSVDEPPADFSGSLMNIPASTPPSPAEGPGSEPESRICTVDLAPVGADANHALKESR